MRGPHVQGLDVSDLQIPDNSVSQPTQGVNIHADASMFGAGQAQATAEAYASLVPSLRATATKLKEARDSIRA